MRIRLLEGFYHVGRAGGYAAAAREIPYPVGQPAVYQQIRGLEEDLGLALVRREGKRILLTPEGRMLHEFIAPFFEGLPHVERRVRVGRGGVAVFAATDVIAEGFLPAKLRRIRKEMPSVVASIRGFDSIQGVLDEVATGGADFGLSHFPRLPSGFRHADAGWVDIKAVVPLRHPLARQKRVTLKDLSRHSLVAYERDSFARSVLTRVFEESKVKFDVGLEATTSQLQIRYVREGLGVALIPRVRGAEDWESGVRFLPLAGGPEPFRLHLVWSAAVPFSPAMERIRDLLIRR